MRFVPVAFTIFLAILSVQASAAAPAARAEPIPFQLHEGHIFIPAYVNGKGPFRFGFDTGASGMGRIDAALKAQLSLPLAGSVESSDGVSTATTEVVAVERLRAGTVERRGLELISRDYNKGAKAGEPPMMGIIGRDFFADRMMTVDYPNRTIQVSGGSLRPGAPGVVRYGPSFTISVCFASGCYPAKLDTGSSRGIVVPKELIPKISAGQPVLLGEVRRTNGSSSLYEVALKQPVKVAGLTARVEKLLYTDPSADVIVVGSDFLKDYVLTIDQRNRLLKIGKPAKG